MVVVVVALSLRTAVLSLRQGSASVPRLPAPGYRDGTLDVAVHFTCIQADACNGGAAFSSDIPARPGSFSVGSSAFPFARSPSTHSLWAGPTLPSEHSYQSAATPISSLCSGGSQTTRLPSGSVDNMLQPAIVLLHTHPTFSIQCDIHSGRLRVDGATTYSFLTFLHPQLHSFSMPFLS